LKIQVLEQELRQRRIQQLGPRSETLSNLQLRLLADEEPGTTCDDVAAKAGRERLTRTPQRERKRHPGRNPLPEDQPHVTRLIPCEATTCTACRTPTAVIGYDTA
jgi:hypothetical protein